MKQDVVVIPLALLSPPSKFPPLFLAPAFSHPHSLKGFVWSRLQCCTSDTYRQLVEEEENVGDDADVKKKISLSAVAKTWGMIFPFFWPAGRSKSVRFIPA